MGQVDLESLFEIYYEINSIKKNATMNNKKDFRRLWGLNPEMTDFLKRKPRITLIGFWWAWYWRLIIAMFVFWAAAFLVFMLLGILFS